MMSTPEERARQTTELLQRMIRNAAVNDGTPDSAQEISQVRTLQDFFAGSGLEGEVVEPHPGRASLVIRIPGTDPTAPSLCLLGHTDVVPVEARGWERDPFAGEIVNGVLWGRGAIDMLNLTASYAVVTREIAMSGFRPRGDLIFAAVADEENGGDWGVGWMTDHRLDLIGADYVLTESGGAPTGARPLVGAMIGEKGRVMRTLRVTGVPGHGSAPWGARSASILAAEAVARIARFQGPTVISPQWRDYVDALSFDSTTAQALTDPDRFISALPVTGSLAGYAHALAHTTISPNIVRAGDKLNVIPGEATIELDIRVLPDVTPDDVEGYLRDALGDLMEHVDIEGDHFEGATVSPQDTPLYEVLRQAVKISRPEADLLPMFAAGGTDGRFYRLRGVPVYGFGVLSDRWDYGAFRTLFHGHNERIDLESLGMTTEALRFVVREFLGRDHG